MEKVIEFDTIDKIISIFGEYDKNINMISNEFGVSVLTRGETLKITGPQESVLMAQKVIENLMSLYDILI